MRFPSSPWELRSCVTSRAVKGVFGLGAETFRYRVHKDGVVRVFWEGRCVLTLGGARGHRLAAELAEAGPVEVQNLLAQVTGNFKRGNERADRRRRHER